MSAGRLRLYAAIQHSAHLLKKAADRELLAAADVTTAQAAVMAVISAQENTTQKMVASALGLNESAVTAMIRRLLSLGYVLRRDSKEDRRAKHLLLTSAGIDAMKRIESPFGAINQRMENAMGPAGVSDCAALHSKLIKEFAT